MKTVIRIPLILVALAGLGLAFSAPGWLPAALKLLLRAEVSGSSTDESNAATAAAEAHLAELRKAAERRAKDPAWKPACQEVTTLQIGDPQRPGALRNYTLSPAGEILACLAPARALPLGAEAAGATPAASGQLRVYAPDGQLRHSWPLEIEPAAVAAADDGSLYVGGSGRILRLDPAGRVLTRVETPVAQAHVTLTAEAEELLRQQVQETRGSFESERQRMLESLKRRRSEVTGLAVTGRDVFVAVPSPSDFTYRVYRFTRELTEPTLIVEKLRGCCGQMDIQTHGEQLWIAHNARHSVECRDRAGKLLRRFGTRGRLQAEDFGGCCEPKNVRVLPGGEVLAAESGPPTCIKRFSAEGKFLEVLALIEGPGDCVRVTVAPSPNGSRYYLLDTTRDAIRVFARKG